MDFRHVGVSAIRILVSVGVAGKSTSTSPIISANPINTDSFSVPDETLVVLLDSLL